MGTSVEDKINVSCSLKRKRPPKIQIPNVLKEIEIDTQFKFGCSPVKNDSICCFEDLGVGVYSIKGKKKFMEDTHKIVSSIDGNSKKGFFGVYDGHGGKKAAEFVADSLHKNVLEMVDNCVGNIAREEAVKSAYLKTDKEFLQQGVSSGSCCVTVLIEGTEMVVSNIGDCRAVLCRGGVAEALTKDHRVEMEEERKRIEDKGGYVEFHKGAWRVHGILSVSRSIGDSHLKDWVVSEPDTTILDLTPNMDFLVLASDGLWEEVGNQEAIDIVLQSRVIEKKHELPFDDLDNKITRVLNDDKYACISTSSSPKVKRVSVIKQKRNTNLSPSDRKTEIISTVKRGVFDFESENESPPAKLRRTSLFPHNNMKIQSPRSENNKKSVSEGLLAGCKKLANLAASRGSMDDITVMVVDLKQFGQEEPNWKNLVDFCSSHSEGSIISFWQHSRQYLAEMMHEPIGIPACFSSADEKVSIGLAPPTPVTTPLIRSSSGSPQSLIMSVYMTKIASQLRLVTITWCKNLLLHGLSVSVDGPEGRDHYHSKVELKPWYFWRKQGCKNLLVDGKIIAIVWDLKAAKFNGEVEPQSDYYVAIVSEEEVVLVVGDMKKDAFRRTGCRPALVDPVLVSRKEHVFGKKRFSTKVKFHERGKCHEISVECNSKSEYEGISSPEMDIKIDGELATQVKHLQWKFRGNESIDVKETKLEVYWDVHDWIFGSGPRHAMFLFKSSSSSSPSSSSFHAEDSACKEYDWGGGSPEFSLFLYAWKVE
ncbi:uncharacterized protein LOC104897184 [Beta vulgaris subsp. vulgaris]|uniref:uncharacterized protein LOC104897184 n=1 Tax=Beta vulgaris subsp. vulgaris TaxID=3555 RepID=UPI00254710F6|nr:uncharacterized protein LOC104897184 [Beta vulgaris subsp. vulgaris]